MKVHLAFAPAAREVVETTLDVPLGTTLADALASSGWLERFPALTTDDVTSGVWGRRAGPDMVLREGDRVEFYRGLRVDPKVARRERFTGQGARAAGLFAQRRPHSKAGY
jgi:putative ubiquitin-RnfH superfamily antitoxin RatB of RatAB toxin-antitoxin module